MAQPRNFPEAGSFYLALTAILLPLTSLWAQNVKQDEEDTKRSKIEASNKKMESLWSNQSGYCPTCRSGGRNSSVSTAVEMRRGSAGRMGASRRASRPMSGSMDDIDLELQALSPHQVNVTNTVKIETSAL
jgi:hypothetical protein